MMRSILSPRRAYRCTTRAQLPSRPNNLKGRSEVISRIKNNNIEPLKNSTTVQIRTYFDEQRRMMSTSTKHGLIEANVTRQIGNRLPNNLAVLCGEVGYYDGGGTKGADVMVVQRSKLPTDEDEFSTLRQTPPLLIEVVSSFNLTPEGFRDMIKKINRALSQETKVVWLIYPEGVGEKSGIQVHKGKYDADAPYLTGDTQLDDGDFNLGLTPNILLKY